MMEHARTLDVGELRRAMGGLLRTSVRMGDYQKAYTCAYLMSDDGQAEKAWACLFVCAFEDVGVAHPCSVQYLAELHARWRRSVACNACSSCLGHLGTGSGCLVRKLILARAISSMASAPKCRTASRFASVTLVDPVMRTMSMEDRQVSLGPTLSLHLAVHEAKCLQPDAEVRRAIVCLTRSIMEHDQHRAAKMANILNLRGLPHVFWHCVGLLGDHQTTLQWTRHYVGACFEGVRVVTESSPDPAVGRAAARTAMFKVVIVMCRTKREVYYTGGRTAKQHLVGVTEANRLERLIPDTDADKVAHAVEALKARCGGGILGAYIGLIERDETRLPAVVDPGSRRSAAIDMRERLVNARPDHLLPSSDVINTEYEQSFVRQVMDSPSSVEIPRYPAIESLVEKFIDFKLNSYGPPRHHHTPGQQQQQQQQQHNTTIEQPPKLDTAPSNDAFMNVDTAPVTAAPSTSSSSSSWGIADEFLDLEAELGLITEDEQQPRSSAHVDSPMPQRHHHQDEYANGTIRRTRSPSALVAASLRPTGRISTRKRKPKPSPLPSASPRADTGASPLLESMSRIIGIMDSLRSALDDRHELLHPLEASVCGLDSRTLRMANVPSAYTARITDDSVLTEDVVRAAARGIVVNVLFRWVMGMRISVVDGDVVVECRSPFRVFSLNEVVLDKGGNGGGGGGDISQAIQDFIYIYDSGAGPRRSNGSTGREDPAARMARSEAIMDALPIVVRRAFVAAHEQFTDSDAEIHLTSKAHRNAFITPFVATFEKWLAILTMVQPVRQMVEDAYASGAINLSHGGTALGGAGGNNPPVPHPIGATIARISRLIA